MLESTPIPPKPAADEQTSIVLDGYHVAEIECTDILEESTQAIVLPTKSDLTPYDEDLDRRLRMKSGSAYAANCQKHLEQKGLLLSNSCLSVETSGSLLRPKYVVHLSTEADRVENADMNLVETHYSYGFEVALMEAARLKLKAVSFLIFTEGKKLRSILSNFYIDTF